MYKNLPKEKVLLVDADVIIMPSFWLNLSRGRLVVLNALLSGNLNSPGMSSTRIKEIKVDFPLYREVYYINSRQTTDQSQVCVLVFVRYKKIY